MKVVDCVECRYFNDNNGWEKPTCTKGFKLRFYQQDIPDYKTSGWKRKCKEYEEKSKQLETGIKFQFNKYFIKWKKF